MEAGSALRIKSSILHIIFLFTKAKAYAQCVKYNFFGKHY